MPSPATELSECLFLGTFENACRAFQNREMVADHQGCEHESQLTSLKAHPDFLYGNFCPLLSRPCRSSIGRGAIIFTVSVISNAMARSRRGQRREFAR